MALASAAIYLNVTRKSRIFLRDFIKCISRIENLYMPHYTLRA